MTAAQRKKTERWVKHLNQAGRDLDDQARAIHPSGRPEVLKPELDHYKQLAQKGME